MRQRSAPLGAVLLLAILATGCGAPHIDHRAAARAPDAPVSGAAAAFVRAGPWLEHGRVCPDTGRPLDAPAWPLVADALADTTRSWLWARLDLGEGVVRVAGVGALLVTVREGDRLRRFQDLGIHVPLDGGDAGYLNSEGGPFTIRARHVDAAAGAPGCLLIALPRLDTAATEVVAVTPVAGRWTALP